jgi:hypothetical protein
MLAYRITGVCWLSFCLALLCGTTSIRGQQCGCEYAAKPCSSCGCRHHCCHHCCQRLESPPQAPILGSAPAMMAPVIFTVAGPAALPAAAPPPPPSTDALRDLLKSIMEHPSAAPATCNCAGGKSAAATPQLAPPQPPPSDVNDQLSRIEQNLAALHEAVLRIDSITDKKLREFDARINRAIENRN